MELNLTISRSTRIDDIISLFSSYNSESMLLNIDFVCDSFINSSIYLFIVAFINEKRKQGDNIIVNLKNINNCDSMNYASRVNFFREIDVDYKENFRRRNTAGRLIPITNISPNTYDISNEVTEIFKNNFKMSDNDIDFISLVIQEMVCNTTMHSKSISGAYCYSQRYIDGLEFILIDNGIGIKKSLEKNPEYSSLTNEESILKALEFEVTNGEGRGHGLFIMKEIVKEIGGNILLYSGNNNIFIDENKTVIKENECWEGVFLKIYFKFGTNFSLESFYEKIEKLKSYN